MKESESRHITPRWTIGRARTLARVSILASLAWAAACGSDSGTGPNTPATPVGSYSITTVNGKSLPVALFAEVGYTYEVTTGTLALTVDGKYSVVTTFRQTIPGNVSTFVDSTGGTWVLAGTSINLTNGQDGSTDQATWANSQLTFAETDGKVTTTYVYAKK
jgi:hypothetical protein